MINRNSFLSDSRGLRGLFFMLLVSMPFWAMGHVDFEPERGKTQVNPEDDAHENLNHADLETSFKLAPSFFIANSPSRKTGKRLLRDEVVAFVQTHNGRVLFTQGGAHIGMRVPSEISVDSLENTVDKSGRPTDRSTTARTVVLKAGFANQLSLKRGIIPRLAGETQGKVNFMMGSRENWQTNLTTYRKLVYDQVWDGISLEYLGFIDRLAFRLILDPGSDPSSIQMETGAEDIRILEDGRLCLTHSGAEMILSRPYAYQEIDGQQIEVPVQYRILHGSDFGFQLGSYNPEYVVIIDPELTWSTYLGGGGGTGTEDAKAIAVDDSGYAYVTGFTPNGDFPIVPGSYDASWNGQEDVFVSKLNTDGSGLIYSTFLGGSRRDRGYGIAVDSSGNAFVTGETFSTDFPTTAGAFSQTSFGNNDVFVCKITSDGSALSYATYLGGYNIDTGHAIALDSSGSAYVTGTTYSSDFPSVAGSYNETHNGQFDVFITKLAVDGGSLIYSTFLGDSGEERGYAITLNSAENAYVTGMTNSSNFPTVGAYDDTANGGMDVFVCTLSADGTTLDYSTFLGGDMDDQGNGIALTTGGHVCLTGDTASSNFPATTGSFDEDFNGGTADAFVTQINATGTTLDFSTYLGGSGDDHANGISLDGSGNIYIGGYTRSSNYPTTTGVLSETLWGSSDIFVSKLNSSGDTLTYSTFIGGSEFETGNGIAVDSSGYAFAIGNTYSDNFPTTSGVIDDVFHGSLETVVSKLDLDASNLIYSTYLGGSGIDGGDAIAVDYLGHAYVTGSTWSNTFPTTSGVHDENYNGSSDVYVVKLDFSGAGLLYATYLGGSDSESGYGICVDYEGSAYVTGSTESSDFPTSIGAFDTSHAGNNDVFVTKLSPSGDDLTYSTFLGDSSAEIGFAITVDEGGNALVTGYTYSSSFPVTAGAFSTYNSGSGDVFVTKFNVDGSDLELSTFLGGSGNDVGYGIAVDNAGQLYVTGSTLSSNYPTTAAAYQPSSNGSQDGFVTKLNSSGSSLTYSTYIGGSSSDLCYGIARDDQGSAYITGQTRSTDYPTTPGAFDEDYNVFTEVFITKLDPDGSNLAYSTFVGGSYNDLGRDIAVDSSGSAYVVGYTASSDFPTTLGAFDEEHNGSDDAFVAKLSPDGSSLAYSTFLGGSDYDLGEGLALDTADTVYVIGDTRSVDFPTILGSYDETLNGNGDAYVSKLTISACPVPLQPGPISGEALVCVNDTDKVYSVPAAPGATGYAWSVPSDATITAGQGTTSITVDFGSASGDVTVTATNGCGNSLSRSLAVAVLSIPGQAGPISGDPRFCAHESGLVYSIGEVPEAMDYAWTVPADATITDGQGTASITVDFGTASGQITVIANNICGSSPARNLAVDLLNPPAQPGPITGDVEICTWATDVVYSIDPVSEADGYTWSVPADAVITSGQNTTSVTVSFGDVSGNVDVIAHNRCGDSSPRTLSVALFEPVQILNTIDDVYLCQGESLSFTIQASGDAPIFYQWLFNGVPMVDGGHISGATTSNLILDPISILDAGAYSCEVSNPCNLVTSNTFFVKVQETFITFIDPPGAAQGLDPLVFTVSNLCGVEPISYEWTDLVTSSVYYGNPLILPIIDTTTIVELVATDDSGAVDTNAVKVLCPANNLFDLNGDGCNTLEDIYFLAPSWLSFMTDLNGDGYIDIRDFLYVNTDSPLPCP